MAFHVDVALQIERPTHVLDDLRQTAVQHRGGSPPADVERRDGLVGHDVGVEVDLSLEGSHVALGQVAAVELLVVGAVRADLLAERDVDVEPERIDLLELLAQLTGRGDHPRQADLALACEESQERASHEPLYRRRLSGAHRESHHVLGSRQPPIRHPQKYLRALATAEGFSFRTWSISA